MKSPYLPVFFLLLTTLFFYSCQPKIKKAETFFNQKKYDETVDITNRILAHDSVDVDALQYRAGSYRAIGQTAEAEDDYKRILKINPTNKSILFALGQVYKEAKSYNDAIETFSKLISLQPDYPFAYYERGFCYGKMGLFPQARIDLESSIRYQPNHGPSFLLRGRALEALGNLKMACSDWHKALDLGVQEAQVYIQTKCFED